MKTVRYTAGAARDIARYKAMSMRIRRHVVEYAADGAHANNVTRLAGSTASRLRVGDFRVIFEDGPTEIVVTKIGPRGSVYD